MTKNPHSSSQFIAGDFLMRLKLAAVGALAPADFDRLFTEWEQQAEIDFDRTLESVVTESGLVSQEQWDLAARLQFAPVESIFAEKHELDMGIRACLIGLNSMDRKGFDMAFGEWTSQLGDAPNRLLSGVAVDFKHCSEAQWLEAESLLSRFRERQAEAAYAAGSSGIDPEIIIACVEAAVGFEDVVAMVSQGNASVFAANRRLLEDYLGLYHPELRARRPVVQRLIAKYDFERLSQAQEFPAFEEMLKAELALSTMAVAIVAGIDLAALAAAAREVVDSGSGAEAFNYNLGVTLLDRLPEIGCEAIDAAR
ncbi:MAG: hypothetical protein K2X27_16235 [Candidatus Obscuribacterales bacterium]|nr:hypothetical protein [Candidatus Obscuribacterales bacterium]